MIEGVCWSERNEMLNWASRLRGHLFFSKYVLRGLYFICFSRIGTGEVYDLANYSTVTDWTNPNQSAMHGVVAVIAAYLASIKHSYEVVKETMSSRKFNNLFEWFDEELLSMTLC